MDAPEAAPGPATSETPSEAPERLSIRERLAAWQYATMERAGMQWPEPVARAAFSGYPLAAVAEELRPRSVFELFLRHREALGLRIVPLTADRQAGYQVGELLLQNWVVALVADRDLSGRGVDVEMFGATRKLPAGPALLSIKTGSPLLSCPCYTTEDGWVCWIGEPLQVEMTGDTRTDVTALTRLLATTFERGIEAKPVDWHMFQ